MTAIFSDRHVSPTVGFLHLEVFFPLEVPDDKVGNHLLLFLFGSSTSRMNTSLSIKLMGLMLFIEGRVNSEMVCFFERRKMIFILLRYFSLHINILKAHSKCLEPVFILDKFGS